MKNPSKKSVFASVLALAIVLLAASPALAVSYTTESFRTQLDVNENYTMHVTETIRVNFTSAAHGIYRSIPDYDTHAYFMYDGELQEVPLRYKIKNVECEGEKVKTESEGGFLDIRIGDADKYVYGQQTYKLEYDIILYKDEIDYLDQLYWNIMPAYWDTGTDRFWFEVNMPKEFDPASVEVITGAVGEGDTERADWKVNGNTVTGGVSNVWSGEGVTIRIVLPEGYWTGVRDDTKWGYAAQGLMGLITLAVVGLFWKHGRDPQAVRTVEFYPPEGRSPAEIGFIWDKKLDDKDMTSLVMWFASKGYLRIKAEEEQGLLKKKLHITLEKLYDLPVDAPQYQKTFFDALFEDSSTADMDALSKSTSFGLAYQGARGMLENHFDGKMEEGHEYRIGGCLLGVLEVVVFGVAIIVCMLSETQEMLMVGQLFISGIIISLCCWRMLRPTDFRVRLMGQIKGFREFIQRAELDRINRLVEQDPDYFYNILPYAYVFGLTDKWAKNFDKLAVSPPSWYVGPSIYMMNPVSLCHSMDTGVRSSLSSSIAHTSSSSFSGGGGGGGGGFSGGGGGGGGGGGW